MKEINTESIYEELGISREVWEYGQKTEEALKDRFQEFDDTAEYNQLKVIRAMQENRVSEGCFNYASGYGYNDQGRDTLEVVYASAFHTEAALVRPQITCGTHALALALSANLRPGDELLSPVGKPYDTLEEVIGIRPSRGSLAEYGITYRQVDLLPDGSFDLEGIRKAIRPETNEVVLSDGSDLGREVVYGALPNWLAIDGLSGPIEVTVRLRHSRTEQEAVLSSDGEGIRLDMKTPARAPTPGQLAVFYQGDAVVGSAWIL